MTFGIFWTIIHNAYQEATLSWRGDVTRYTEITVEHFGPLGWEQCQENDENRYSHINMILRRSQRQQKIQENKQKQQRNAQLKSLCCCAASLLCMYAFIAGLYSALF